ncbi:MAG: hypothetical protein AAF467_15185 [Actinomycetota bacterium]
MTAATLLGRTLALLGFLIGARAITDNSFLTHLATGRLILTTGSVPSVDPYSVFGAGEAWTVQSWLVSVVYAALEQGPGLWSIRVFHGAITATVTLGLWRLSEPARQLVTRVMLVSLALLIGTFLWPPRPLLIGLLGMVVVLLVLERRLDRRLLVPLFWVWVNSHGSFVLGAGLVGLVFLGSTIDRRRVDRDDVIPVLYAAAGCLAGMVGPLGWRVLWFPLHMMGRSEALERVSEWASPSFRSPVEQLYLLPLALLVVAATRGAPWRTLLPSLVFFVAGLLAVRNLGLATIVIVALVAPSLAGLIGTVTGERRVIGARLATAAIVALAAVVVVATVAEEPLDLGDYPVAMADWMDDRSLLADAGVRVAQRDYVGNYLIHRKGAQAQVFMDDRFDFHALDVIEDHNTMLLGGDIDAVMARRDFDVVLWGTEGPLARWLVARDDWVVVESDEDWLIACRRDRPAFTRCTTR